MIYIAGNVPSLKNTKRVVRGRLIDSKRVREYKKYMEPIMKQHRAEFVKMTEGVEKPYHVKFHLVRDSRRRFDFHNVIHILADLMVTYEWIEDDNADIFVPVFEPYTYQKNDGGVYIWV